MASQTEGGDPTTAKDQAEPKVQFVTARPDSSQARSEIKSLIRAHASRASWAKIRQGKHSRQEGSSQIGSGRRPGVQQPRGANTGLASRSNDEQDKDITHFGETGGPSGSRQVVRSRRPSITRSYPAPNPLRTVAAGDIDPFTSYPSRLPKEIATPVIAQVNHYFNTMFLPDPDRLEASTYIRHWISWYMNNSVLFHALCYSQLARLSVTEASGLNPVSQRAKWYCYSMVVVEVNRRFNNVSTRCSDESILAVLALAFHGVRSTPGSEQAPRSPSQGPLNSMQGLDLYSGRLDPVHMHVHGLAKMLAMRGGVDEIRAPGLAAMLSYGELILASRSLQRPALRFVPIGESPESTLATVHRPGHPLAQLGTGFRTLYNVLPSETAQELYVVVLQLSTYLLAVDDYIMGRPQAQSVLILADQRNFVQHSLMSLYSSPRDETTSGDQIYPLRQATWCAGVVYSLTSIFPIPRAGALFAKLASRIKQHLIATTSSGDGGHHEGSKWREAASLMLWITFMGLLASTAHPDSEAEKTWYISVLERLVHRMQILSWQRLKDQLLNFLWFPSTSDTDGQRLWREIHTSNPFRES
ncbi:hypothetical protein AYL99_08327 [Fonsecaea erecta]|uniref:Transcription factor domain-containing protein n=1 Tax=Fonsecaea erecta TaxID=1367422 RepID=A0A178ZCV0_9EURO|nr:hypothetical protein AYL99_08327 [Fonsecaea erecta]OAP57589.1 hypothetical protein AYL99_08327 [Fonsecaea erecta]